VRKNTEVVVVTGAGRSGAEEVSVWDPDHDGVVFFVSREDFERAWSGHALIITAVDTDANVFKSQPPRETTSDTAGDISPIPSDLAGQHTPLSPMRAARASTLSRATGTPWRSLGLPLGLAAATIVATAGIAVFLLTPLGADRVASPGTPGPEESALVPSTLINRKEAAPSAGVLANAPVVPTAAAASASATPSSTGPAGVRNDGSPLGAPTRDANPAGLPAEAAASTVAAPAAQMSVAATTPVPAEPPGGGCAIRIRDRCPPSPRRCAIPQGRSSPNYA
jgi:hypothetical protein